MAFVNPAWLLLSGLALLVLVLHMQRRRTLAVPSILLWEKLASPVRPRSALHLPPFSWPLILQVLVVLLVAAAFARPLIGGDPLPDHRIVVIDASASMRATDLEPSRFAAAIERAEAMLAAIPPSAQSRVSVLVVSGAPRLLAARYDADRGLLDRLAAEAAGDGGTDWAGAGEFLRATLVGGESVSLTILTDDEVGAEALAARLPEAALSTVPIWGRQPAPNAGLTARVQLVDEEAGTWRAEGTVWFSGDTRETTVRASFQPEGSSGFLDWGSVEVRAAPDAASWPFKLDLDIPGAGILALDLPADIAPHDNQLRFVVRGAPRKAAVLHVGEPNEPLARALLANGAVELFEADTLPADDGRFDLVVVDGVTVARQPATNTLFIGSGSVAGEDAPTGIADPVTSHWRAEHVLSRGVAWPELSAAIGYRTELHPGAEVVVEAAAVPLVQARTTPEGREVRVALDLRDTTWSQDPSFPVFIGNVLDWLGPGLGAVAEPACEAGVRCAIDARFALGSVVRPDGASTSLWPGTGAVPEVLPPGYEPGFVPGAAGLYRLQAGDRSTIVAVNPPSSEVGLPPPQSATMPPGGRPPTPLRWWLLALMLLALLLEAWIAGRGNERFLHPAALAASTPFHGRRRTLLGLRAATVLLAGAALIDLRLPILPTGEDVVAIAAPDDVPAILAALSAEADEAGVVALGSEPMVLADIGSRVADSSEPMAASADLARALTVANAMLPADRPGRIVLATDGSETRGDLFAARAETPIAPVDIVGAATRPDDLVVASVTAPSPLFAGDSFPLTGLVFSRTETEAGLAVSRDGVTIAEQPAALLAGWNRLETMIREAPAGEALYEVAVTLPGDPEPANNANGVWLDILGDPAVAIITPEAEAGERLREALAVQGLKATVIRPSEAPWALRGWLAYDAFILANAPAIDFGTRQMEELESAVRDHGRGLLILGGENSFGPGGYYQTPLERLSPLSSRVPREAPKVALAFVLDRSGSMQQEIGGVSRLDIAKQAALNAIELLQEESEISVVVFDSEARVLIPRRANDDLPGVASALAQLDPGGGTSIYPGMALALEEMRGSDAAARHMIVMTDGLSEPGDFRTLLQAIDAENISVSTVAIGEGADGLLLEAIARMGGGAFHQTTDFAALPSILSLEAMMLSGAPTEEHRAVPTWRDHSQPFLAGLPDGMPAVGGFVLTTAKPEADLHLTVTDTDGEEMPLLASWRYGNGHVAAFTSHGVGAWTADWVATPDFPLLWGQLTRHFLPDNERSAIGIELTRQGDEVGLDVTIGDGEGGVRSGVEASASIRPRGAAEPIETVPLREIVAGRFRGALVAAEAGEYTIRVESGAESRERSFHVGFPAILDFTAREPARTAGLAAMTGGRDFTGGTWTRGESRAGWAWHPGWPAFTMLALLLFLVDLTIRYAPRLFRLSSRGAPRAA